MPTVLVVDDSPVDRRLAGRLLERNPQLAVDYAAHGVEALRNMESRRPDLVLTDLQMPNMDGLRLVEAVRRLYPGLPVVIMTAHGSEDVAVKALMSGAAGFVPKGGLNRILVDTVESVLALAHQQQASDRLVGCVERGELLLRLPSDPALIPVLADRVRQLVSTLGLVDQTGSVRVAVAFEEALRNSLYHGNLELAIDEIVQVSAKQTAAAALPERLSSEQRARSIGVRVAFSREQIELVITDQGHGFDPAQFPSPDDPLNFSGSEERGRGLVLMRIFMDEVTFNAAGNEVRLVKRCEIG
jgi:CheY-like chemotaxis protein